MPSLRRTMTHLLGIGLVALSGCAHNYVPGPGKSEADRGRDWGHCNLLAHSTRPDTSFAFAGSPKNVAIASGAALLLGAIGTAVHDTQITDDCMQASGWLVADGTSAQPAAAPGAQQVAVTAAPLPPPAPPVPDERTEAALRAQQAAQAWIEAQSVLNGSSGDKEKRELNTVLCNAGDRSACVIALAIARPPR